MSAANRVLLRPAAFDDERIARHFIGAGVIPVATHPVTRERVVLLAREGKHHNYRGSLKWSGFEGGRRADETVRETALREWREESLGCVPGVEGAVPLCEIVINVKESLESAVEKYHVTQVHEVVYDDYPAKFSSERHALLSLLEPGGDVGERALQEICCRDALLIDARGGTPQVAVRPEYLEKDIVSWFSTRDLMRIFQRRGRSDDLVLRPYFLPVLEALLLYLNADEARVYHGVRSASTGK